MKLKRLLGQISYRVIRGKEDVEIQRVRRDSREVEAGDVFVCIRGYEMDGHIFIEEVQRKGAAAVIIQERESGRRRSVLDGIKGEMTVVSVTDTRLALAVMAASYYGYPARELTVIGITGTKGKTTTAYMIWEGLKAARHRTGLIGTVQIDTGRRVFTCGNTTPDALKIQEYLREMADAGCDSVVMEVSSQALKLKRTCGILFEIAVFTNLGRDHIGPGEHADMKEYLKCKRRLFFQCGTAVGNLDDGHLWELWQGTCCQKLTYGSRAESKAADYYAEEIQFEIRDGRPKTLCVLKEAERVGGRKLRLKLSVPGRFNVSNALAAAAVLSRLKVPDPVIEEALERVQVPGRMESLPEPSDAHVLVDYAHNAMSLKESLLALREYHPRRLMAVFGCGGNRSSERRGAMGEAAGRYADFTIITTDNPRYEDPEAIIRDIEKGMKKTGGKYKVIADRQAAIRYALRMRQPGDLILIAGKGHEDYQEIRGVKYPMDDRELVKKCTQILS